MTSHIDPRGAVTTNGPILVFEHVHARDAAGPKGRARGTLAGPSFALGPGVFAFVGAPEDGTLALAELLSGARAPLRGRVTILGQTPASSSAVRARIGSLAPEPWLPDARTVARAVAIALAARGERDASAKDAAPVLDALGLGHLGAREPRSLAFAEQRAAELALALSMRSPLVVALHEPLSDVAINLLGLVRERIRELAAKGACVVVTTSSPADARALADRVMVLHKGRILGEADAAEPMPGADPTVVAWVRPADVPSELSPVRLLAQRLSTRPEVRAVSWDEGKDHAPHAAELRVSGNDLDACALALVDVAAEVGVVIEAIAPASPGIVQVRAAAEALDAFRRVSVAHRPGPPFRPAIASPPLPQPQPPAQPLPQPSPPPLAELAPTSPPADTAATNDRPDEPRGGEGES
jgi:ABC-2 type transport system ATP-binding protein